MEMSYETTTFLAYGIILTDEEVRKLEDEPDPIGEVETTGCVFEMYGDQVGGDTGYVLVNKDSMQYGDWCEEVGTRIGEDWNATLKMACESVGFEYREPSWLLVSEYG
jgi:hypothetical protein